MDHYESEEQEKHWKAFATPAERTEYKHELVKEAKKVMNLPLSERVAYYKKAEQEYGNEHMKNLVSIVRKQRQNQQGMER